MGIVRCTYSNKNCLFGNGIKIYTVTPNMYYIRKCTMKNVHNLHNNNIIRESRIQTKLICSVQGN